jgi:hypothetical protein
MLDPRWPQKLNENISTQMMTMMKTTTIESTVVDQNVEGLAKSKLSIIQRFLRLLFILFLGGIS